MQGAFAKLTAEADAYNKKLEQIAITSKGVNPTGFQRMQKMVAQNSATFRAAAASTGMWETEQIRVTSATDNYTRALEKQKLSFRDLMKNQRVARAAYREQLAMQNAVVRQLPGQAGGKSTLDLAVPNAVSSDMDTLGNKIGWIREQTRSAATQMINWGKNTQWAGRQLMVGFTLPLAAFGAAAATTAYQVDQAFTRIKKVYDTTADQSSNRLGDMQKVAAEFGNLQANAFSTAKSAAQQYGTSMKDTLGVQADLAATGMKGAQLQAATTEVVKNAMLGEIDYQTATTTTIALQQQLHLSNKQLADSWAYMNSVENSTSLQMKDFAAAIPIALGPMKQMGGGLHELGTLMTAMVSRGVQVGKAANAIKALPQRLSRPSKQVQEEFQALTGQDIVALNKKNPNNIIGLLTDIEDATRNLSKFDRRKALAGLFGSFQLSTMTAMLDGMHDLENGVGQVSKAQEIGQQTAKQWGDVQRQEIGAWQQSASGQFKRAVASFQAELVQVGKPFLAVATVVIKAITSIIAAFNSMPKVAKYAVIGAAGFAALVGPVVMLVGLFANFAGNMLKFGVSMTRVLGKMEILNKESAAAKAAANLAEAGFVNEASSVNMLTAALNRLIEAQAAASRMAPGTNLGMSGFTNAGGKRPLVTPAKPVLNSMVDPTMLASSSIAARQSQQALATTEKIKTNWKAIGGGIMFAGAGLAMMNMQSKGPLHNMGQMVLYATMLTPLISAIPWKTMGAKIAGASGTLNGGFLKGLKAGGPAILSMVVQFAKFAGPAGLIAAAVAGLVVLHSHIDDNAEALAKLNNTAGEWAKIFGYAEMKPGQMIDPKTGSAVDTLASRVKELQKAAPEVGQAINKAMNDAGKGFSKATREAKALQIAIQQGNDARLSGASADQAREVTRTALMAGIGDVGKVDKLMKQVDLQVNFKLNKSVLRSSLDNVMSQIDDEVQNKLDKTTSEKIWDVFTGDGGPSRASEQAGKNAADDFYKAFAAQQDNPGLQATMARQVSQHFEELYNKAIGGIRNNKSAMDILGEYGINSKSSASDIGGTIGVMNTDDLERLKQAGVNWQAISRGVASASKGEQDFARELGHSAGLTDDQMKNVFTIDDIISRLVPHYKSISKAQEDYQRSLVANMNPARELTNEQKLQLLNVQRQNAGLEKTGNLGDMFGDVTKKWTGNLDSAGTSIDKNNTKLTKTVALSQAVSDAQVSDMLKGAMTDYQQGIADQTTAAMDARAERATEAVAAAGERRTKALENRQQAATKALENRQQAATQALENRQERATQALENRQERATHAMEQRQEHATQSLENRQKAASDALDRRQAHATASLENRQEKRRNAIAAGYDARIKKVDNEIKAEQKADEIRKRIFDAEMTRIDRLNEKKNTNIDFNVALNSGNLDEAAKIRNDAEAKAQEYAMQDALASGDQKSTDRQSVLQEKSDKLTAQKDKALERIAKVEKAEQASLERRQQRQKKFLERQQQREQNALKKHLDAEKRALELSQQRQKTALSRAQTREKNYQSRRQDRQKTALANMQDREKTALTNSVNRTNKAENRKWQKRKDALADSLKDFMGYIAKNDKDLKAHIKRWQKAHHGMTLVTQGQFDTSSKHIEKFMVKKVMEARRNIVNSNQWNQSGQTIAKQMIDGAFGLNMKQFKQWMRTGVFPDTKKKKTPTQNRTWKQLNAINESRHEGGIVGSGAGSRAGVARTAPLHPSERIIRAQVGERIIDRKTSNQYGDVIDSITNNTFGKSAGTDMDMPDGHSKSAIRPKGILGGASDALGPAALMMAGVFAAVKNTIGTGVESGAASVIARQAMLGMFGSPGAAAGFDAEQMKNAATIANVGSSMHMSKRDIEIAFMAAIVESRLRNLHYGDRDSQGLFQMRPSMGWGSVAQVTDPQYASRKFFSELKKVGNRGAMSMGAAAQAVERSGRPGAYAPHQDDAARIYAALKRTGGSFSSPGALGAGFVMGRGGHHRPINGPVTSGIHDGQYGWPGLDFAGPVGRKVYAVGDGTISRSYDIRGYEPRRVSTLGQDGFKSYGRVIYEKLDSGPEVLFAHLSQRNVRSGQRVKGGSVIGRSGASGHVVSHGGTGAHLHFAAKSPASPMKFLNTGGYTASDGPAFLHQDELVLNPNKTDELETSLETFSQTVQAQKQNALNFGKKINAAANNTSADTGGGLDTGSKAYKNKGKGFKLRTGTFNLFKDNTAKGQKQDVSKLLPHADVLSLTEYEKVARHGGLAKYLNTKGWGVHAAAGGDYADTAVAWNKKRFKYLTGGTLNINPNVKSHGGGRSRMAAYAELQDRKSGTRFWQVATHLVNHESEGYARILANQMYNLGLLYKRLRKTAPVFMAGDWNATMGGYNGGIGTSKGIPNLYSNWAKENFKRGTSGHGSKIDAVLTGKGNKFVDSQIMRGLHSDHDALLAQYNIPGLAKGGTIKWDNTLANLHKGERVLTADLSRDLEKGMSRFASGGNSEYNVNVHLYNADLNAEDVANKVNTILRRREQRLPQSRRA